MKSLIAGMLLAAWATLPAWARPSSAVQDQANILNQATIAQVQRLDDEIFRATGRDLLVVTTNSPAGSLQQEAHAIFRRERLNGMLILIVPQNRKLGLVPARSTESLFNADRLQQIRQTMTGDFRRGDFNAGVVNGATLVRDTFVQAPAGAVTPPPAVERSGGFNWLWVGLALLAGFFVIRWIARMFVGNPRSTHPGYPGSGGYYPGGQPGGGGGGFWSGLAGGIGGALLGNTLYDTFAHRHGHPLDEGAAPLDEGAGAGDFSDFGDSAGAGDFGGDGGGDW